MSGFPSRRALLAGGAFLALPEAARARMAGASRREQARLRRADRAVRQAAIGAVSPVVQHILDRDHGVTVAEPGGIALSSEGVARAPLRYAARLAADAGADVNRQRRRRMVSPIAWPAVLLPPSPPGIGPAAKRHGAACTLALSAETRHAALLVLPACHERGADPIGPSRSWLSKPAGLPAAATVRLVLAAPAPRAGFAETGEAAGMHGPFADAECLRTGCVRRAPVALATGAQAA